jgi:hypothetical protein
VGQTLSSHNKMVWEFMRVARMLATEAAASESLDVGRARSAVCILTCVSAVEAYLNIFGRLWISQQNGTEEERNRIANHLSRKANL